MIEGAIFLALTALLEAVGLLAWSAVRGATRTRGAGIQRAALAAPAALVLLAVPVWELSGSRTLQLGGAIVPRVDTASPVVALTFDDGPFSDRAEEILPLLASHGVKGTFFLVGSSIEHDAAAAARIAAEGHELGNHTYSHKRMMMRSTGFIRDEIERTDSLIRATGYRGTIHVRSPYCKKLLLFPLYLLQTGRLNITFDVEPDTYLKPSASAEEITGYVLQHARPGSIVLLHPWYAGGAATRAALPGIIEGLQANGYRLVTVSEMLAASKS